MENTPLKWSYGFFILVLSALAAPSAWASPPPPHDETTLVVGDAKTLEETPVKRSLADLAQQHDKEAKRAHSLAIKHERAAGRDYDRLAQKYQREADKFRRLAIKNEKLTKKYRKLVASHRRRTA